MNNIATLPSSNDVAANQKGQVSMLSLMMNETAMANIERMANMLSNGLVSTPEHLRDKPADCFAICLQAMQWGMNPFAVAQKTHLVKGTLGYEAQLVNAVIVNSGVIKGRFSYEFFGPWEKVIGKTRAIQTEKDGKKSYYRVPDWTPADESGCGITVSAVLPSGEVKERKLMLSQVQTRNSTLWAEDPQQQMAYVGVKRWSRLYTPDVIMGVYTVDELEERDLNPLDDDAKDSMQKAKEKAEAARQAARTAGKENNIVDVEPVVEEQESFKEPDEVADLLQDYKQRMTTAGTRQELADIIKDIAALGTRMSDEQKETMNALYKENIKRLIPN